MTDKLHMWEKAPIVGLFLAQGLYVWRWYVGDALATPAWVLALAGIAAVAAIDGAMVATVAGMRQGRRSRASVAAIVVTAGFGAAVALDLYGALALVSAWLHAGFALTIVCYLLHLAHPRARHTDIRAQRRRLVRRLVAALRNTRAEAHSLEGIAAQAEHRAAQLAEGLAQARAEVAQAETEGRAELESARALASEKAEGLARAAHQAAQLAAELQAARAEVARLQAEPAQVEGFDPRTVAQWLAQAGVSGREIARRLNVGESTVRNWTKPARATSAAD
jgi:DNA-binding transcriptional regulator YiaG